MRKSPVVPDQSGSTKINIYMNHKKIIGHLRIWGVAVLLCGLAVQTQAGVPALVQSAGHDNLSVDLPFCTAAFPSNNTAGNLIVVAVEIGATAADRPSINVSDSQGNTYYPATSQITWRLDGGGDSVQLFYAPNIRGGSNIVTWTELNSGNGSGAGNQFNQISIHEYSGVCIASPLDVTAVMVGTTTNNNFLMTSGSATTSVNGELIFGYANTLGAALAPGAGFTPCQSNVGLSEYLVQTTAGSVAATETNGAGNMPYVILMATFKPASTNTNGPVLPPRATNRSMPRPP